VEIASIFKNNEDYISSNEIANAVASFLAIESKLFGFLIAYNNKSLIHNIAKEMFP
jgi:hypothetical protein